jgi:DNA-binding GntR family transcriptional regulator
MSDPLVSLDATAATLSQRAAAVIERAILNGELMPGQKLRVQTLMRTYGIGATPVREGLSRLVAIGLVEAIGWRGFRVAEMGRDDLEDILRMRTLIECEGLRLAIAKGDDLWEAQIVAALHRLRKCKPIRSDASAEVDEFDRIHKLFHAALIAACDSPRLIAMQSSLYDQTCRYRRLAMSHGAFDGGLDKDDHDELAELVLARATEPACVLLKRHLQLPIAGIYGAVPDGDRKNSKKAFDAHIDNGRKAARRTKQAAAAATPAATRRA